MTPFRLLLLTLAALALLLYAALSTPVPVPPPSDCHLVYETPADDTAGTSVMCVPVTLDPKETP